MNRVRLILMFLVTCVIWICLGGILGLLVRAPYVGLFTGGLVAIVYCALSYLASERFALDLYDTERLDPGVAPRLYEMVAELSEVAGIEPPLLHLIPINAPNAMAVAGRNNEPHLCVTQGLTQTLEREEVRAILALMIARIVRGDVAPWTVAATLAGIPLHGARSASVNDTMWSKLEIDPAAGMTVFGKLLLSLVIPPSAFALQIAFDKSAIAAGDDRAVKLTGNPLALATGLAKIESSLPVTGWGASGYNPATAILFAVPPLPPPVMLSQSAPSWVRAQRAFPYYHPTASERGQRLMASGTQPMTAR